jgi:hypothetical protein
MKLFVAIALAGVLITSALPSNGSTGARELSACLPLRVGQSPPLAKTGDPCLQSELERSG